MRRRWLINALAGLSLLLCLATAGLWARSYFVEHTLIRGTHERLDAISVARGRIVVELLIGNGARLGYWHETCSPGKRPRSAEEMNAEPAWRFAGVEWSPSVNVYALSLAWPAALVSLPLGLCAVARRRASTREREGHCMICGYDLRATPGRCPECGVVPPLHPADPAP